MKMHTNHFRLILTLLSLIFVPVSMNAQHNWSVNVTDYEKSGEILAVIVLEGVEMTDGALGAFVGGECRGIAEGDDILFFEPTGKTIFSLMCYSNESSGEILSFKFYNPDDNSIYAISETQEFYTNMREGTAADPIYLHVVKNSAPIADCPDVNSLEPAPGPITFNLCEIFSDPDGDLLTFEEAHSVGSNVSWLDACSLEYTAAPTGVSTLSLSASDGELSAQCDYTFTVGSTNTAPVLDNPVGRVVLNEGFATFEIDLDTVFIDNDGDALSFSSAVSNSSVVTNSVSGSILTLTEQGTGNSSITISAADAEYSVMDEFTVVVIDDGPSPPWTVNPNDFEYSGEVNAVVLVNNAEVTSGTLAAFVGSECRGIVEGVYFPRDERTIFSLLCYSNSNGKEYLNFKFRDEQTGQFFPVDEILEFKADMIVGTADAPVTLNVNSADNIPVVSNPIPDQVLEEHFISATISLKDVFSDASTEFLTYTAESDNHDVAVVTIASGILSIYENGTGTCMITVNASNGVFSVDDRFLLTINEVNDPPVVVNPIPDQNLQERFGSKKINISSVFSDPEGKVLDYSVSSSDTSVVKVTLSGPQLVIQENNPGTCTISLCVEDEVHLICDDFQVYVEDINLPPETDLGHDGFPDISLISGFGTKSVIDICQHFSDPDNDQLSFSASSSNIGVVEVEMVNCDLLITETGTGISNITICAQDADFETCFDFSVLVTPQNSFEVYLFDAPLKDGDSVVASNADTSILLIVLSAIDWDIETTSNWASVSRTTYNAFLHFDENESIEDRSASFSIRDTQDHILNLVLIQKGKPDGISRTTISKVYAYPNPVNNSLQLLIEDQRVPENCRYVLVSVEGKLIAEGQIHTAHKEIDMSSFEAGIYYLKILDAGELNIVLPIIKL